MFTFLSDDMMSRKTTNALVFLVGTAFIAPEFSPLHASASANTQTQESTLFSGQPEQSGVLLAQKKKRKKKKKKRKKKGEAEGEGMEGEGMEGEAGAAPSEAGAAAGVDHGKQESPGKYKWQISLLSDFKIVSQQTGESKSGSGNYDLDALGLYVIGDSLEVGGGLVYNEETQKYEDSSNKSTSYLLKLKGVYNFGNINTDSSVFFTGLSLGFGSTSSKIGDGDEAKSSVTQFGLGLGMHWFVDSNVAFTAEFSYDTGSAKADGADEPTKFSEIHIAKMGFSLFL